MSQQDCTFFLILRSQIDYYFFEILKQLASTTFSFTFLAILSMALTFIVLPEQTRAESKRAFKLLEKGDYDKLIELLDKAIEKDSINTGAKYVYSLLYLTPKYKQNDIERSYSYINAAIADFKLHDEKMIEDLSKLEINDTTLTAQKTLIEHHAFQRAKSLHTIRDYNYFMDHFNGAIQSDSAVMFRNEIAYNDAVRANTYEAFQSFMSTYPDAKQYNNALENYEDLLYKTKTSDGLLRSYTQFLKFYPDTPYREDAELNIFEISTADNDLDSYMTFIERYPESHMRRKALDLLYHCYKEHSSAAGFSNRFNILQEHDSLLKIARAETGSLMAIFEMDKYGFSKLTGEKLIDFTYSKIKRDYYCGDIKEDYLEVEIDKSKMIVSRLGGLIFEGEFESVEDLGCGALKIGRDGYFGVYHKSGMQMVEFNYQDVGLVANAFIKYKFNGKWGLKSFSDRDILPPRYDDIYSEGRFVLVENGGLYALQNVENLAKAADKQQPELDFKYDDYELIYSSQLLLFKGNMETVVDLDLKENIKLDKQNFYELYDGWMVKKNDKYRIYDQIFYPLSRLEFEKVDFNRSRAAIKHEGKWGIYSSEAPFPKTFEYDSVRFLSEQIGVIIKGDSTFAIFENDSIIDISYSKETRLLRPSNLASEEDEKYAQYLLTKTSAGVSRVFNINGYQIINGKYSSIEALGREYLLVEQSRKKGLFHRSGNLALKIRYSAIGNYNNGYVSTLINGKFGIYNYERNVFLSAKYQKALKPFGSFYFIGSKGSTFGLVDLENKDVTGYKFDEILDWNDTVALVKEADEWKLYDVQMDQYVFEGISEYEVLRDDEEEKLILITKEGKSGILSNRHGEIVGATFNDIINIGTAEVPVYFAEKYIIEADFYVVIYYDATGKILRKQIFTEAEEYDKIYCG